MKKTSKKLLSLFLAVVMIITSCSVGFTAFAADQPAKNSYWSNKSDAEAAFDSLNDLADTYIPMLLNIDAIKNILEGKLGMKVTDKTTISDVVVGASPLLLGLLGGSADKGAIRGDSSPLADTYFAYLEDENAVMDFYSLYKFCQDNKNAGGELGEYASKTFDELEALLNVYKDANDTFNNEIALGEEVIGQYIEIVDNDSDIQDNWGDSTSAPLEAIENVVVDGKGTKLKNVPLGDAKTSVEMLNGLTKGAKTKIKDIDSIAKYIYYFNGMGQIQLFAEIFLGVAQLSGLPLMLDVGEEEKKELTMSNYAEIISKYFYSFEAYCDENDVDPATAEEAELDFHKTLYNNMYVPMYLMELVCPDLDGSTGPFFYEMNIGILAYSKLLGKAEEVIAYTDSLKITDEQIDKFIAYAKDNCNAGIVDGQTSVNYDAFVAYINSGDCAFSEPVKTFIRAMFTESNLNKQLTQFIRLATDGKKDELKEYQVSFGYAIDDMPFIDALNYMIPSVIANEKINNDCTNFQANNTLGSFISLNQYFENIASKTAESKYVYADHAVPANLTVNVVNDKINGLLDQYLKPGSKIAGLIDINEILNALLETGVELYKGDGSGVLDNLWLNLYEQPIETVFKLLPILDILLDELIVPLLLNGDNNDPPMLDLYAILTGEGGILAGLSQKAGPEKGVHVGIGALNFDLNTIIPSILHWITGDEDTAYEIVGKYNSKGADADYYANLKAYCDANVDEQGNRLTYDGGFDSIPKFTEIYAADKAIYKFKLTQLTDIFKGMDLEENVAVGLEEAITELATFAMEAFDEYIDEHGNDARYGVDYGADPVVTQRGLNNIMVALPMVMDTIGKKFIAKYKINSDWTYCYDGKLVEIEKEFRNNQKVTQLQNVTLQEFKESYKKGADAVLDSFVNILIGNWINSALDFVNDIANDKNNEFSKNLALINELLNALGGFGEKSIVTDIVNGFFGLTRKDKASFTLKPQTEPIGDRPATGFNGFNIASGFFLLTNIQYDDNGTAKGIVPLIMSLVKGGNTEQASLDSLLSTVSKTAKVASLASLASSRKSAAGTDYNKLLTKENIAAADELVSKIDTVLTSLLKNTSINGFDLTSTDSILSAAITTVSNYLGADNTEAIVNLLDEYLTCITGNNTQGPIDAKKVYSSANLSNLVVKTYSLVEDIADTLLAKLINKDVAPILADAICGIISPDSVGIRMSDSYSTTAKILLDGHTSWKELDNTNLKFGFRAGDKTKFYDGLGESLNGIATVVGFLLSGVKAADGSNYYSSLIYPIFNNLAKKTGAAAVMTPAEFNKANDAQKLVKGIITPVSNILAQLYKHPATFLVNVVQGLAAILDDSVLIGIFDGIVAPINDNVTSLLNGVVNIVNYLSPTLSAYLKTVLDENVLKSFPIDLKKMLGLSDNNVVVNLINKLIKDNLGDKIDLKLPNINWSKLANAKSAGEAILIIYGYVVDTILGSGLLTGLIDSLDPNLSTIIKKLNAAEIIAILNDVIDVATTPTEIYWTFSEYASTLVSGFSYPAQVSASDAELSVSKIDSAIENIFPLLKALGIDLGDSLSAIVTNNLYTNEILTTLAKAVYGALDGILGDDSLKKYTVQLGLDFSPAGIARLLTDKSYGATYSDAALALIKADTWDDITELNWGFKNGSKMAAQGFVNGLAAILRPLDNIMSIILANGTIDIDIQEVKPILMQLLDELNIETALTEDGKITLAIAGGQLTLVITGDKSSTIKVDIKEIASDAISVIDKLSLNVTTNGYENAVVPILEAFMCENIKTYDEYLADIAKAKDNVLLDVLNPLFGFVNKVVASPIDTITGVLPNVAYFIDSNGLTQAISNLFGKILSEKGVLGVLDKHGFNVDEIISIALGKDLGTVVTDALGIDVKFNLEIMHLEKCNIQDIIIPLVNTLIVDTGISIPNIDFGKLAGLGTLEVFKSAARNSEGNFQGKRVIANKGQVLISVLRYVGRIVLTNLTTIKNLLINIEAISSNETIKNVIIAVFDHLANASEDDFIRAILYFFTENTTDSFFDYSKYQNKNYEFNYGDIDAEFMADFAGIIDGSIEKIFAILKSFGIADITSLTALVNDNLYKNDLVAAIATGLYGAIEGVKIDETTSLVDILAMTEIDFSAKAVAGLLVDKKYGQTYPDVAKAINNAGSWANVKAEDLDFGVTDKDSFLHALAAVLRPIYGVLDVLFNDGSLNIFNIVSIPGSNGYESTLVPILEALGVTGLMTVEELNEASAKEYDQILLNVLVPVFNWLEGLLNAPIQTIGSILPSLALFIANDGYIQAINNLLTPVSALLKSLQPIVDVNEIIKALGLDVDELVNGLLAQLGIKATVKVDIYDLQATLKPVITSKNIVPLLNSVIGMLGLEISIPEIDWFKLASHGEYKIVDSAARNSNKELKRATVEANVGETLLAVLRYVENVIISNATAIKDLLGGIEAISSNATISAIINDVLTNVSKAKMDDLVKAILYFFTGDTSESFYDYLDYVEKEYKFNYGDIDAEFMAQFAGTLDGSIEKVFALLKSFGVADITSLTALVNDNLYKNDLIAKLATGLYGAIEGVQLNDTLALNDILAQVGIDFSAKNVAKLLTDESYGKTYSKVADAITKAGSWANVKAESLDFGVTDRDSFVQALVAVLRPIFGVIDVIFNSGVLNIFDIVKIPGSNAYESALVPILEALGVTGLKTVEEMTKDAEKAYDNILLNVINPVFDWLEGILDAPIESIGSILPSVALFIANNGLIQAINNLLTPVSALLNAIKPIVDVNSLIKTLGLDIDTMLNELFMGIGVEANVKFDIYNLKSTLEPIIGQDKIVPLLNAVLGMLNLGITIPEIDWFQLASHGEYKTVKSAARNSEGKYTRETVEANVGETLLAVLRYVENLLITNANAIKELLGGIEAIKNNATIYNIISDILNNISKAKMDDIIKTIFYFFNGEPTESFYDYLGYIEKEYTFNYGDIDSSFMSEFANIVDGSIEKIFALLKNLGVADITSLTALVNDNLYKNDLIAKLATGLYGAIEGVKLNDSLSLNDILAQVGIDFSAANVANLLTDRSYGKTYSKVAKVIEKAGSWSKVKAEDLDFGVTDRDSFVHALVAVLRPVFGVIDVLFNNGSLNLFDIVSIPGSNAYESTLVPILEAFGITDLKTVKEMEKDANKAYDNILLNVINPVLDGVEVLLNAPFNTLGSILPSVALFIANDGLIQAINNLLTPVSALLKAIKPIVDVNSLISALGLDLNKTVGDLLKKIGFKAELNINLYDLKSTLAPVIGQDCIVPLINGALGVIKVGGSPLGIKLPAIDWFKLASHGEYKTVDSAARNTTGKFTRETVEANVGETLLAVLRYVETLITNNADALSKLLGNIDAIKNNATILKLITAILANISKAGMDDLVKAILYFFEGRQTDAFFDFTGFQAPEASDFAWGELDQEFCETLPPMLDGLVSGLLEDKGGLLGLISGLIYKDEIVSKLATALYGAIEGVELGEIGSLNSILKLVGIDFSTDNVAELLVNADYGTTYALNAAKIKAAGSWKNIKPESLSWGVTDRASFVDALCAVLRPIYGVLDVLLNDGLLNLYDIVSVPGSDGYTSTIVPLLEAFSCYNVKTQYQYREDMAKEYDAILKDILNPLLDKVEDLLNAPIEVLASMLPNLALFFANDGLLQIIDNLLTPISALLGALRPIVDVNELLDTLGVDLNALIAKSGLNLNINLDIYDLKATLQPIIGAENVVGLLNKVLGIIKIKGAPLGIVLPEIDWLKLASHGDLITTGVSAVATHGSRMYVLADTATQEAETLIAVLRFIVNTVNYQDNYQAIVDLVGGLIGGAGDSISDVVGTVLNMLKGDADTVILSLVDLLKSFS